MKRQYLTSILFLLISLFSFNLNDLFAQSERALVRKGNQQYMEGNFSDAEVDYRKSINKNPENDLEASVFNLGNALYKQERFEEAATRFERAAEMAETSEEKAKAYHNLGNSLLKNSKLEESIEAYKNALRNNSKDPDTRYNLAYAQQLLKQQQEQQQQQQDQQEQNENENENENQDQQEEQQQNDQENQEQNENEEQQEQEEQNEQQSDSEEQQEQEQNQQQQQQNQEQEQGGEEQDQQKANQPQETRELTKEEAARLLEALKNEELKVQQKLNRQKGKADRVRIEKDW